MATTYTLKVQQLDCLSKVGDQSNVVFNVHWAYTADDGKSTSSMGGNTAVAYTAGSPFTPFDQLTEEQVVNWVFAAWSSEDAERYKSTLDGALAVNNPPLPWGSEVPATPAPAPGS